MHVSLYNNITAYYTKSLALVKFMEEGREREIRATPPQVGVLAQMMWDKPILLFAWKRFSEIDTSIIPGSLE